MSDNLQKEGRTYELMAQISVMNALEEEVKRYRKSQAEPVMASATINLLKKCTWQGITQQVLNLRRLNAQVFEITMFTEQANS